MATCFLLTTFAESSCCAGAGTHRNGQRLARKTFQANAVICGNDKIISLGTGRD